ncbi:MAG: hypothetical protein MZU84_01025 [Sphingobacterium sp.]|nr:hypothetical protein [Sphingobacterium sp.]
MIIVVFSILTVTSRRILQGSRFPACSCWFPQQACTSCSSYQFSGSRPAYTLCRRHRGADHLLDPAYQPYQRKSLKLLGIEKSVFSGIAGCCTELSLASLPFCSYDFNR